jgi:hypothetical protein
MRRSELAQFLIDECEEPSFVRAIVGVSASGSAVVAGRQTGSRSEQTTLPKR